MMLDVATRAVAAMRWRATQLVGIQLIYFLRLLVLASVALPLLQLVPSGTGGLRPARHREHRVEHADAHQRRGHDPGAGAAQGRDP